MNKPNRFIPGWPFPPYQFIPGENPHPKKAGGHSEGKADPVAPAIDTAHPEQSDVLRYSLDLYNHGYFWESHVYLEALWNAHGRQGSVADFLKALIKLGAAGVKRQIKQNDQFQEHLMRAIELIESVKSVEGVHFLGFNLDGLVAEIQKLEQSQDTGLKLIPAWS